MKLTELNHVLLVDDDEVDSFVAAMLLRRIYPGWSGWPWSSLT